MRVMKSTTMEAVISAPPVAGRERPLVRVAIASVGRIEALDFVKGALVLFMILYHWISYFVAVEWDVFRYLRFLTPSFTLVTGFLVSHTYLAKYSANDPRLRRRLLVRGAKM